MAKVSIKFNNNQPLNESVYEKTPCEDEKIIDFIFKHLVDTTIGKHPSKRLFRSKSELPKKIEDISNVISNKIRSDKRLCINNLDFFIKDKILKYLQDEKNEISPYCREQLRNQMEELNIIKVICGDTSSFEDFEEPTAEPETVTQPTQSGADKEEKDDLETRKSRVQPPLRPKKRRVKTRNAAVKTKKARVASDPEKKEDSPTEPPVEVPEVPSAATTKGTTSVFRRRKKDD